MSDKGDCNLLMITKRYLHGDCMLLYLRTSGENLRLKKSYKPFQALDLLRLDYNYPTLYRGSSLNICRVA